MIDTLRAPGGDDVGPERVPGEVPSHPPNGLELSCPAEAGNLSGIVRQAGGQDKPPRRPSPPGQLQRVVGRHIVQPLGLLGHNIGVLDLYSR
jgi:hypothetical protein